MACEVKSTKRMTAGRQLSRFLSANLDAANVGWPRWSFVEPNRLPAIRERRCRRRMRVLIVGELRLDVSVRTQATRAEWSAFQRGLWHGPSPPWRMNRLRVGGFVGYVTKVAFKLGADVTICTHVPVPVPGPYSKFFDRLAVDRRYLTGVPGSASLRVLARCADGHVIFQRRGLASALPLDVPRDAVRRADAILMDTCAFEGRSDVAHSLCRHLAAASQALVVGVRLDGHCRREELELAQYGRTWTYFRREDGRHLVDRRPTEDPVWGDLATVKRIHDDLRIAKVVLQLGDAGAVMLNGNPMPYRVPTCPLHERDFVSPGDTLMAVTTLSSAGGADDLTSLRRGVAAATGQVAGLDLPTSFLELDADGEIMQA